MKGLDSETSGIDESLRNAKLLLKKSKRVDYYKLLEISQDANDYDIKKVLFILLFALILLLKCLRVLGCVYSESEGQGQLSWGSLHVSDHRVGPLLSAQPAASKMP